MGVTSWIGSVWSLRREQGVLVGQVREVDGESITLAMTGLGDVAPDDLELLPPRADAHCLARVTSGALLGRWKRMGGAPA